MVRTALESKDTDLRSLALRGALENRALINFKLSRLDEHQAAGSDKNALTKVDERYHCQSSLLAAHSNVLPVQVKSCDYQSGSLAGYCMIGLADPSEVMQGWWAPRRQRWRPAPR